MSGISEIKKKAKLSIDEMYDNQQVGKLDNQENGKTDSQPPNNPFNKKDIQPENQKTKQPSGQPEFQQDKKQNFQSIEKFEKNSVFSNSKQQQTHKIPTYKMTFNLTEDVYKAFNDLYAKRMLQGRKTEKSAMICEAIQWLIKIENEQTD